MNRLMLALIAMGLAGCATGPPINEKTVPNIAGSWVGFLSPLGGLLALGGVTSGEMRATLTQEGRAVTGSMTGPGFEAKVWGRLYGHEFSGSIEGATREGAGSVRFDARVEGDRMEAILEHTPVTLRRTQDSSRILMKNPRTDQVLVCEGPMNAIEQCVAALERDGWKRLVP